MKVAAASPKLKVANPHYNIKEIVKLIKEAAENDATLIVFPGMQLIIDTVLYNCSVVLQKGSKGFPY